MAWWVARGKACCTPNAYVNCLITRFPGLSRLLLSLQPTFSEDPLHLSCFFTSASVHEGKMLVNG
jgi:hypothetical protein